MNGILEFVRAFISDSEARHKTVNLFAFLLNVCYIFFNLTSGIIYENIWSVTVSAYYTIIVSVRYLVIGDANSEDTPELIRASRTAAYLLLILGIPVTGIIIYTVFTGAVKEYPDWILFVLAVYSFFSVFRSLICLRESLKTNSITMFTAYSARLSASLMSFFNFQTSFLANISVNSTVEKALNFLAGSLISLSVFCLALSSLRKKRN